MLHLDLFSGIGGFSLALDQIFYERENKHIFVEWDSFCQAILRKHWPTAEIYGDIRAFIADARSKKPLRLSGGKREESATIGECDLITGGFPCQPFSHAGRRKGTTDDRYLWPEMLECVTLFRPRWVIAENVAGLASWNEGLVLETVCSDLEKEGYEVQPFVIPAVAVGTPHRRDRIWIIAHLTKHSFSGDGTGESTSKRESEIFESANQGIKNVANSTDSRLQGRREKGERHRRQLDRTRSDERGNWDKDWTEVAAALCRVDDGVPRRMDRTPRLKALGNAIVPQVAKEIIKAIKEVSI